jgi:tetratricopeptide (TPR) repeat protein
MYRWQSCFPGELFGRLAMIMILLAAVEAGLSSSRLRLWPASGLSPATAFALDSPGAAASTDMMHAGLFDWFKSKPEPKAPPPPDPDKQRRDQLRQLQVQHDKERDLAKKIEYDRKIIELLDPYTDLEKIRSLQGEIQQHEQEMQQHDKKQQWAEAISLTKKALEEKRYADAERDAEAAIQIFDDAEPRQLRDEARTRRLVEEAKTLLAAREVDKAHDKNQQALQQAPNDPEAQNIRQDIDNILGKRKTLFVLKIAFMVLLAAGMFTGLYFLLRTREWLLEGVDGPCQDKVFPLDKDEMKIGALGPPNGECDLVIRDARHRISPLHCMIVRSGRHWYLMNESTNGTTINGEEVEKGNMVRLRKGDRLSLADEAVLVLRTK